MAEEVPLPIASSPGASPSARRSIFARGTSGFESELNAYLQDRLRFGTLFGGLSALLLYVAARVINFSIGSTWQSEFLHPSSVAHLAMTVVFLAAWLLLRTRPLKGATLRALDGLLLQVAIATCVVIYHYSYTEGIAQIVPVLALALNARAAFVPSRATTTALFCVPALPGILAVDLAHATAAHELAWNQVVLAMAVSVAAVTSKVNYSLRVRAYEALQVDRYTLEKKIGEGAMGEVFLARHGLLRRPTAVKLLRPEITGESTLRRFEHEVRQTARLTHPNTIAIYDYGQTADGVFYYAMEFVDGADLERIVERTGPMPASRAIHVLAQVCGALAEAHANGLVHRDVKPANVLLCRRGGEHDVAKVMDFGLVKDTASDARLSMGGEVLGTPLTMAPETIRGKAAAPPVDVYALGAVGCFLLTGKPIFDATSGGEFLVAHLNAAPVPPSSRVPGVPADLEALLLECLAKSPDARPPSMSELRRRLLACADAHRWTEEMAAAWWTENASRLTADDAPMVVAPTVS